MTAEFGKMLKAVITFCLLGAVVCSPLADFDAPGPRTEKQIREYRDFLVKSSNAQNGYNDQLYSNASIWENSNKYQGDMILNDEQIDMLVDAYANGDDSRAAYIRPNRLWPDRTIVYEFAAGHFSAAQRNHILYSMTVLESRTCIRFRHRQPNERHHALITGNPGCFASVGFNTNMANGRHTMNVHNNAPPGQGCLHTIVIIHEWLHVIGFFHMQSAYNRYDYVRVNWQNIQQGMGHNFDRWPANLVSNLGLPYEYGSCMHYGPYAFSINGRTTMDARWQPNANMGHMRYVTSWDFHRVQRHYGCESWRSDEDIKPFYGNETIPDWVYDPKYNSDDIDVLRTTLRNDNKL